jgi:hypothetical protein
MLSFLRTLLGLHGRKTIQSMTNELVKLDPKSASQAQLLEMERDLDKAGRLVGELRTEAQRERREAVEVQARYDRLLRAGEHLNSLYTQEADPAKKADMEASLTKLVGDLEALAKDVEVEVREADEAEQILAEAEAAYMEKATDLRQAKGMLDRAAADMQRAKIQHDRANAQAERAAQVAGLRSNGGSGLNTALVAMQRQADEARAAAETARMKAKALGKVESGSADDPLIARSLAATARLPGTASTGSGLGARLAALSAKPALPAPGTPES